MVAVASVKLQHLHQHFAPYTEVHRSVHPAQVAELLQRNELLNAEQLHKSPGAYDRYHSRFGNVTYFQLAVAVAVGIKIIRTPALAHGIEPAAGRNARV